MWYISDAQHTRILSSVARPAPVAQHVERIRQLEQQRRRLIGAIVATAVALLVAVLR